ncbi:HNH endonuclease [Maribacter aquivivus]|uniref:HNH endonuclease n=1 Tax=Maribacter aquivivus TaxID=228958 RepID=A0A1M6TT48_9FLAO|nr:HNH endonuclease signature motif containing protein [Maribacter aquivivus]SHK60185.1 HNH endonuclease [Maribacter aquivivus]
MISINQNIISNILDAKSTEVDTLIAGAKQSVVDFRNTPDKSGGRNIRIPITLKQAEIEYLDKLISEFESIVKADPKKLKVLKSEFDAVITGENLAKHNKEFKNELLVRMGYSKLRNDYYSGYFESTGLKACVYCNSQLAVTVRSFKGSKSAKFQVDHFLPKSEYPCFSISFFNLLPVCGPCNGTKQTSLIDFNVYSNDPLDLKDSPFKFRLDKKSIVSYRINGVKEKLVVKFDDPLKKAINENFDIEGIYSTQKDIAEELILKSIIYNEKYLKSLRYSFGKLYPDKIPMAERLLVGNYTRVKDIHKRPMSKFTQDIARQLKLIK